MKPTDLRISAKREIISIGVTASNLNSNAGFDGAAGELNMLSGLCAPKAWSIEEVVQLSVEDWGFWPHRAVRSELQLGSHK